MTKICHDCGGSVPEVIFRLANCKRCNKCQSTFRGHAQRKRRNADPIGHRLKLDKTSQGSPQAFIGYLLRATRQHAIRRGRTVSITREFLISMFGTQRGRCAICGVPMTHKRKEPTAISIDRRDSSGDYTEDNVQLVCQFVNLGKREYSNSHAIDFFAAYDSSRE
jgi:hypothetical protein